MMEQENHINNLHKIIGKLFYSIYIFKEREMINCDFVKRPNGTFICRSCGRIKQKEVKTNCLASWRTKKEKEIIRLKSIKLFEDNIDRIINPYTINSKTKRKLDISFIISTNRNREKTCINEIIDTIQSFNLKSYEIIIYSDVDKYTGKNIKHISPKSKPEFEGNAYGNNKCYEISSGKHISILTDRTVPDKSILNFINSGMHICSASNKLSYPLEEGKNKPIRWPLMTYDFIEDMLEGYTWNPLFFTRYVDSYLGWFLDEICNIHIKEPEFFVEEKEIEKTVQFIPERDVLDSLFFEILKDARPKKYIYKDITVEDIEKQIPSIHKSLGNNMCYIKEFTRADVIEEAKTSGIEKLPIDCEFVKTNLGTYKCQNCGRTQDTSDKRQCSTETLYFDGGAINPTKRSPYRPENHREQNG